MRVGIVGCGINGAYTAYRLAKRGHEVTAYEAKKHAGGKPCSGLISERIWSFVPKDESLIENTIESAEIRFPRKKVEIFFKPKMFALDREGLDRHVMKLAQDAGAAIMMGHKVTKIICPGRSKPCLVAECDGRTTAREFDIVIGCDGANSAVREHLKLKSPRMRLGMYAYTKRKSNKTEITPTASGFRWKIPRGERTETGILERPENAKKMFKRRNNVFAALLPEGLTLSNDRRFALCGDAAGLTKAWSGGGVIWGMTAADLLARSNLDAAQYNRMLKRHFGPRMLFSRLARRAVYFAGTRAPWLLHGKTTIDSDWLY